MTEGGAERVCANIANGLSERGHDVSVLTDLQRPVTYKVKREVNLISKEEIKGKSYCRQFMAFLKLLKNKKPDVIISILYDHATIAKLASKCSIDCPVIVSDHNAMERPTGVKMYWKQYLDKFYRNYYFDYLTVLTQVDKNIIRRRFKNVRVMYNPLELSPTTMPINKEKIVLAVGRMDSWYYKGFDNLIKAWKQLGEDCLGWNLKIIGSGSEKSIKYLESIIGTHRNIQLLPYTENIIAEYQKADVFILSSRYEGWGLVLLEAMSQGCACVACDYKGRQSEIIEDNVNGLLCSVDNVTELSQKIKLLLKNPVLRDRLRVQAMLSLDRFKIDNVAREWENLINDVLNHK